MTPVIVLIITVTAILRLVVILTIVIHLVITQIFPIISTVTITITMTRTRTSITIKRNRIVFLQINIKETLIAELNIKLRNLKIILI